MLLTVQLGKQTHSRETCHMVTHRESNSPVRDRGTGDLNKGGFRRGRGQGCRDCSPGAWVDRAPAPKMKMQEKEGSDPGLPGQCLQDIQVEKALDEGARSSRGWPGRSFGMRPVSRGWNPGDKAS